MRAAADDYDRAARETFRRRPRRTDAGTQLRFAAVMLGLARSDVSDAAAVTLLTMHLAQLVEAVVELREVQPRTAQAAAARRAAQIVAVEHGEYQGLSDALHATSPTRRSLCTVLGPTSGWPTSRPRGGDLTKGGAADDTRDSRSGSGSGSGSGPGRRRCPAPVLPQELAGEQPRDRYRRAVGASSGQPPGWRRPRGSPDDSGTAARLQCAPTPGPVVCGWQTRSVAQPHGGDSRGYRLHHPHATAHVPATRRRPGGPAGRWGAAVGSAVRSRPEIILGLSAQPPARASSMPRMTVRGVTTSTAAKP